MADVKSIMFRVDHCETKGLNGWFKENGSQTGKPKYKNLANAKHIIEWKENQWTMTLYPSPYPYILLPYILLHNHTPHYKHPDISATQPPERGWTEYNYSKPSTTRITYIADAPDGWQKHWGENNDTIVYHNAASNETVSNIEKANECDRKKFQAMTAAPIAPSPWVKTWDDQQREVVYHHPHRNETVLTVAAAQSSDQKTAMTAAPTAPSPWVKKWSDQHRKVVYHHPHRNETMTTVDATNANDAVAAAPIPPASWFKHWNPKLGKVVFVHNQRNETVATVDEAMASDRVEMKTLRRTTLAKSIAHFISPVNEAKVILANLKCADDGGSIVDSNPNSNIGDAVVLLQQFVRDVASKCVIPEFVLQSDTVMSQIDTMWLELKARQQNIKDAVNSDLVVSDELVVSRNNVRAALVKHAESVVSTFNNNRLMISSIETNLTSFLQSLHAWMTISDNEHASEVVTFTTDTDIDTNNDTNTNTDTDTDTNTDTNTNTNINTNTNNNIDNNIHADHAIGVVMAALACVDKHHADAIQQQKQTTLEIQRLLTVFYSMCTRVGAEESPELFSTLPPTLDALFDAIDTQQSLSQQLHNTFPESEIRGATAMLCRHLQALVVMIQRVRDHVVYCEGIVSTHKQWLGVVPDVTRLKKLSKSIRVADRKYHTAKLDEQDAIEEDEEDGTTTAAEATRARVEALKLLQSTRHKKDTLISQLVRQKEEHFPELDLADAVGKSLKEMFSSLRALNIVSTGFLLNRDCITHKVLSTEGNHTVYEVEFADGAKSALKHFPLENAQSMNTFRHEAALLHRLAHPHIVELLGVHLDENGTCAYIEMPLYNGGTLTTWLAAEERSPELLRAIVHQLLQAVHHLHAHHVVHSDVHPSNIFITNDVETGASVLVLGDFDVSVNLVERTLCFFRATKAAGHDGYIAPELLPPRNETATTAVDMYAVGVVLALLSHKIDSPNFTRLVATMLSDSPQLRPTAHTAMQNPYFLDEQAQVQAKLNEEAATLAKAARGIDDARLAQSAAAEQLARDAALLREDKEKVAKEWEEALSRTASTVEATAVLEADRKRISQQMQAATRKEQELVLRAREAEVLKTKLEEDKQRLSTMTMHLAVPSYWCHKDLTVFHASLQVTHFMMAKLQHLLRNSPLHGNGCNGRPSLANATVTRVVRNENTRLWNLLVRKRYEMRELARMQPISPIQMANLEVLDVLLNEVYLLHGTSPNIADLVSQHGFDERVASMGGLYGAGTYFAENSCKSMQYTQSPNSNGEYVMIYSRVLLGHVHDTSQGMPQARRAPDRSHGVPHDSVVASGGNQIHREFIVYDRAQTYPEFIVYFKP